MKAIQAWLAGCMFLFGVPAFAASASDPFQEVIAKYLAANPKPQLSEEAYKYKVQAEFALQQKQFELAAQLLAKALEIAPWWPAGHFNRALVLGELKQYQEAMLEMKRYLLLEPNAPDARAAQDKIYQWDLVAPKPLLGSSEAAFLRAKTGKWSAEGCNNPEKGFFVYRKQGNMVVGEYRSPRDLVASYTIDMNSVKFLGSQGALQRFSYRRESISARSAEKSVVDFVIEVEFNRRRTIEATSISDGVTFIRDGIYLSTGNRIVAFLKCEN